jgi:hypothetical protein
LDVRSDIAVQCTLTFNVNLVIICEGDLKMGRFSLSISLHPPIASCSSVKMDEKGTNTEIVRDDCAACPFCFVQRRYFDLKTRPGVNEPR